jgi:hypothetical protein
MRLVFIVLAALALSQCAGREEGRFRVGDSPNGFVVMGIAKAADARDPRYSVLWRLVGPDGVYLEYDDARAFEPQTNARDSLRVVGLPGEFAMAELPPGVYALDSVFAALNERGVTYYAQGTITTPGRPTFEVRAGEAVYLGIWETRLDYDNAVASLWRMDEADMRAVERAANATRSAPMRLARIYESDVACTPRRMINFRQREIC